MSYTGPYASIGYRLEVGDVVENKALERETTYLAIISTTSYQALATADGKTVKFPRVYDPTGFGPMPRKPTHHLFRVIRRGDWEDAVHASAPGATWPDGTPRSTNNAFAMAALRSGA